MTFIESNIPLPRILELVSLPKTMLTDYVGSLSPEKLLEVDRALAFALDLRIPLIH